MYKFTLPSGQEVEITEMTGIEEDVLTNRRLVMSGEAINQVLLNCVKRIGDNKSPAMKDVLDLLSGDRLFILVKVKAGAGRSRGQSLPFRQKNGTEQNGG